MNHRERIGQRIAQLRQERDITQEQLAGLAGIDRTNVNKIEKGRYNVSIDIIGKVVDALGVKIKIE